MTVENIWKYVTCSDGVVERHVTVKALKKGRPITVVQLTDMHFNYCNDQDMEEADPVLMSTYKNRIWLRNGSSLENAQRCLEHAKDADQIVITGDLLDYLSHGCLEMAKKYVFEPYPHAMVSLGNHEPVRRMQGEIPENTSLESRIKTLEDNWLHDIYYSSKILDGRVMIIQMDDCATPNGFWERQIEPLMNDLTTAREQELTVLIFYHVPLATENPEFEDFEAMMIGDENAAHHRNLKDRGVSYRWSEASGRVCDIIRNSADVIKGCFCGDLHNDFYCEILAKNKDGEDTVIPQYVLMGTPYDKGHVLKITIE